MQIKSTPPIAPPPLAATTTTRTPAQGSSASGGSSSPSSPAQSAVNGTQTGTILSSYSTNAGGKTYSASVEETGGTYVASAEVPPEASASGTSVQSAENNLDARIDAMV